MDSLIGTIVADRYQVLRLLGRGGMGRVYEVELTQLKKRYAIKVLAEQLAGKKDALLRFRREAEIVASLKHPNIIEIIDWATLDDGRPLYVMELLEGTDLEERIKLHGALPWQEVATIAAQSVSALLEAHGKGILHRDLKPTNVFVCERGSSMQVKLIDFGLAKARDLAAITMHTSPKLIGTPAYMSPGQLEGKPNIGEEVDCWAMAAVLYEAATARKAFKGAFSELFYQIGKRHPIPIAAMRADAPAAFADAIAAALTPDANRRITSLEELGDRIANALLGEGGGAVKASLRSMARENFRDEDKRAGLPDTLPWGARVEDADAAGQAAGQRHRAAAARKEEARNRAEGKLAPALETLPWGASDPKSESKEPGLVPANERAPIAARTSQRVTKPERVAKSQGNQQRRHAAAEGPASSERVTRPARPAAAIETQPASSPASVPGLTPMIVPRREARPTDSPLPTSRSNARYGLWLTGLAAIALPGLVLLSTLGDAQQPSSEALQEGAPRSHGSEVSMEDAHSDARAAQGPPAAIRAKDAAAREVLRPTDNATALGTLHMGATPADATLQVMDARSNETVFDGLSPKTLRLPAGQYRIRTEKRGYLSNTTVVELSAIQTINNQVVLKEAPATPSAK